MDLPVQSKEALFINLRDISPVTSTYASSLVT
jgi:hypothetical protein